LADGILGCAVLPTLTLENVEHVLIKLNALYKGFSKLPTVVAVHVDAAVAPAEGATLD
jgi:hypothetical protein